MVMMRLSLVAIFLAGFVSGAHAVDNADCSDEYSSTFAGIQEAIFAKQGCTSGGCHDLAASGGLDLSPDVAYANLHRQPAQTVEDFVRVVPGQKDESLLYRNVAARTLDQPELAPLRGMPAGGLPPLNLDHLEALRIWIEFGAPEDGVVPGTAELLDACLPPAEPIRIDPLPPPPAGLGVQIRMPQWILDPHSERELCFASYYDVCDQVPEGSRGPGGDTFRYKRAQVLQQALSHHLIANLYLGNRAPDDPVWGPFTCKGGANDGEPCDPLNVDGCGADGDCGSEPVTGIACFGFGPPDSGIGLASAGFAGAQETGAEFTFASGVYAEVPCSGIILWNHHAFNLSDEPGTVEAWLNFDFAPPEEQEVVAEIIFNTDDLFAINAPAFGTDEVCNLHILDPNSHLFQLSSHMHQRGQRFRVNLGAFVCDGGPNDGDACTPFGPDLASPDLCAGAACRSLVPPAVGDCNQDLQVSINELIMGVNIVLGNNTLDECRFFDGDGNGTVGVNEVVAAVKAANEETYRDPFESLLYTSFIYNDPVVKYFDPPLTFGGTGSAPETRALTYCALYDNGFTNPDDVKRQSTSPPTPLGIPGLFGGPCAIPTGCTDGRTGQPCSGGTDAERDASCDSSSGLGDGWCDACVLLGGVTTEDEMFLLMGSVFVR